MCTPLKEPCIHYRFHSAVGRTYLISTAFAIEETPTMLMPITNKFVYVKPHLYKCDDLVDQGHRLPPGGARLPMKQTVGVSLSLEGISERNVFTTRLRTAEEIYYNWPAEAMSSPRSHCHAFYTRTKCLVWNWPKAGLKDSPTNIPSPLQSLCGFNAYPDLGPLFEYGRFLRKPSPYHFKYGSRELSIIPNCYDFPVRMAD